MIFAACPGKSTGGYVGDGVGRGLDEVGGHLVEAEGVHDGGEEILEALCCD